MFFEWDEDKNKSNLTKHGIDFETAAFVFNDDNRLEYFDFDHSVEEERFITIGAINDVTIVVVVVYTVRTSAIRIISARKATKQERNYYYGYS
ncbi:MAG: BrnT family toxin [Firmicutes bacterium]|nr:BrnT family toxin [Bacillota bacterium]